MFQKYLSNGLIGNLVIFVLVFSFMAGCGGKEAPMPAVPAAMAPEAEADPALPGPTAMQNIDKAMGMMMGGPEKMKMMQQMMMSRQSEMLAFGEKLYNDPTIGGASKGISCASCHPQGGTTGGKAEIPQMHGFGPFQIPIPSLVGSAATFPKFKAPNADVISLAQMNNNCIAMFVGGKRLPLNGEESHALTLYLTNLSKGQPIAPGKMGM